jgi:hypothetical protein
MNAKLQFRRTVYLSLFQRIYVLRKSPELFRLRSPFKIERSIMN